MQATLHGDSSCRQQWGGWRLAALIAALFIGLMGCAGKTPRKRYLEALDQRSAGDVAGFHETMLALAHEAPQSRAGRRARAYLRDSPVTWLATAGALAAWGWPILRDDLELAPAESEPRAQLRALQQQVIEHTARNGQLPERLTQVVSAQWPESGSRYVYLLHPEGGVGGKGLEQPQMAIRDARDALRLAGVVPFASREGFLIAAVGNIDADPHVDIWTIDHAGNVIHVNDDRQ